MTKYLTEWIPPVIDRTQEDVDNLLQLDKNTDAWLIDSRGALNYSDLVRIGVDIGTILEMLGIETRFVHLYPSETLYPNETLYPGVVTYESDDSVYDSVYEPPRYLPMQVAYYDKLETVLTLIMSYNHAKSTTPTLPIRPYTTYQKWNDIEQILLDTHDNLAESIGIYPYAGNKELYCDNDLI